MRPSGPYLLIAALALGLAGHSLVVQAQPSASASDDASRTATREPSGAVRTGKERLGNKWSDEQRLDNCKVPFEKRGSKPRPDSCAEPVTH
jgi:hypothetical protein